MLKLFRYIESVAPTTRPVLIRGETGVGKELVARAIHRISGRKGDFVAVNVAGLDDSVFSDTLFGHVIGAFTGADAQRNGLIERAAGGTLFLDEIGDPLPTIKQATRLLIETALEQADNNQSSAAAILGITQQALSKRLKTWSRSSK